MEHTRINLDEAMQPRKPIDASWTRGKKLGVGIGAAVLATTAAVGGVWLTLESRPPRLPRTASEAVAVLSSERYDAMDEQRQRQYSAEAGRLLRDLSEEERRALWQDEANREAMRKLMEERFDEFARRFARGEDLWSGLGSRPQRTAANPGERPPQNTMTEEERTKRVNEIRDRLNERMMSAAQSGNAQESGLRGEMFKRMARAQRGG